MTLNWLLADPLPDTMSLQRILYHRLRDAILSGTLRRIRVCRRAVSWLFPWACPEIPFCMRMSSWLQKGV